ncbi:hypothetical protein [Pseudoalteromonas phenolica]|uniref:hypothetical protein n=1 Tax=Pseudoalteromonas phenolica TaxID=161398 RepID=UPI0026873028
MIEREYRPILCLLPILYFSGPSIAAPSVFDSQENSCSNQREENSDDLNLKRQLDTQQAFPKEAKNKHITKITLKQLNVFDTSLPEEDNFLFRFANNAHITTEPDVILSTLLFSQGSKYNIKELEESERLLRQQSYLYDARIYAEETCKNEVHVTVVTRDLWTLLPDISFSRSGGENSSRIGFRESNLLGYGKRLSFTATEDKDRNGYLFVYDDPAILSSRYRGRIEYADNSDGERHYLGAYLPFYSIKSTQSYGFYSYSNKRVESIYSRNEAVSEFLQDTEMTDAYYGIAVQAPEQWTYRYTVGLHNEKHNFSETPNSFLTIAKNREVIYPYLQGQWLQDDYIKVRNFDSIYRTEDLNLGWNVQAKLGYSSSNWVDDDSHLIYHFSASKAHYTTERSLWRLNTNVQGEWNTTQNKARNFISTLNVQYYLNTSIQQSWFANLSLKYAKNLTADKQLVLGGETGLRGYPLNYQQGSRSILVNLEKRYYWEYDLLHLFKVGGALFFDAGKVTGKAQVNVDNSLLKNIGLGLRLAPSRANAGIMLHLDIAAPINREENIDSVQWLFTVKNRF